jgi:hypothetical protein
VQLRRLRLGHQVDQLPLHPLQFTPGAAATGPAAAHPLPQWTTPGSVLGNVPTSFPPPRSVTPAVLASHVPLALA